MKSNLYKIFTLAFIVGNSWGALMPTSLIAAEKAATEKPATQLAFGIDCMIHDSKGAMLKDLGMVGMMMDGSYMAMGSFTYNELKIEASLSGPFAPTPEVKMNQLRLTIMRTDGTVVASATLNANPDTNIALFEPSSNLYLHCEKMEMR